MVKILVVDDAYFVRIKMRGFLEVKGYQVLDAANGEEALSIYELEKPDIVFCDITMPVMDGLTTLKRLTETHKGAKVVMLTSVGEQAVLMEALSSGAKNFLVKPFEEDKVLEIIHSLMK